MGAYCDCFSGVMVASDIVPNVTGDMLHAVDSPGQASSLSSGAQALSPTSSDLDFLAMAPLTEEGRKAFLVGYKHT